MNVNLEGKRGANGRITVWFGDCYKFFVKTCERKHYQGVEKYEKKSHLYSDIKHVCDFKLKWLFS